MSDPHSVQTASIEDAEMSEVAAELNELALSPSESGTIKRRRLDVAARFFRDIPSDVIAQELGCSVRTVRRDIAAWKLEAIKRTRIDSHELRGVVSDVLAEKDDKARYDAALEGLRIQTLPDGRSFSQVEVRRPLPADAPFSIFPPAPSVEEVREGGKLYVRHWITDRDLELIRQNLRGKRS